MVGRQGVGQQYEDANNDVCNTQDGSSTDENPWTEVCGRKFNKQKFVDGSLTKVGRKSMDESSMNESSSTYVRRKLG
jgi:hypothetical protein